MNWELASVAYWPTYRRRLWRRRLAAAALCAVLAVPLAAARQRDAATTVNERVFDEVATTVEYRYFDGGFNHQDWQAIVHTYRPQVLRARDERERYELLQAMLARLGDSHTAVFSPTQLRARRGGGADIDWRTVAPQVGYLRLTAFPDSIGQMLGWAMADLGSKRSLVLDLRGNSGGLVDSVDAAAGVFLPPGTLISSGLRRINFFGLQRFVASDAAGAHFAGRVIVLIDDRSQSGAESLARALQFYGRATVIGRRSAGKVMGVDVEAPLADGGLLRVATIDMRAPDGRRLEGRGVQPDILVTHGDPLAVALRLTRI